MKEKSARWRSGRGRRKRYFRIEARRNKDVRGRCGAGTRCVFRNVNRVCHWAGAECGVGQMEIMSIMENARLEFEVRHNVRDQATG